MERDADGKLNGERASRVPPFYPYTSITRQWAPADVEVLIAEARAAAAH